MNKFRGWASVVVALIMYAILTPAYAALAQEEIPAPENPPDPISSSVLDGFLTMSNEMLVLFVGGIILSAVFTFFKNQAWPNDVKTVLFFLCCCVFGLAYTFYASDWSASDWGRRTLVTFGVGTGTFLLLKSGMQTLSARGDRILGRTA